MIEQAVFWMLGAVMIVGALGVILLPNTINSVMLLLLSMLALAGIYVLMGAHVVALFQIIIYIGAVLVLFIYVIMLLNLKEQGLKLPMQTFTYIISGFSLGLLVVVVWLFWQSLWGTTFTGGAGNLKASATVHQLAVDLFSQHILIFELTSVLLLVAAIGAIIISKK
ncbi:MAG: NADH-quinone oxidoreductase subunit J [Deltaproteobacteria bacterium]|nr:NADH-quinone oxidoreductase subunit J [Deltaproteobacteria bacterium]